MGSRIVNILAIETCLLLAMKENKFEELCSKFWIVQNTNSLFDNGF